MVNGTVGHRVWVLQFALDNQGTSGDDGLTLTGRVLDHDDVVALVGQHAVELLVEVLLAELTDGGQDAQAVEEAIGVVALAQRSELVALRKSGRHLGGDEVSGKEAGVRHGGERRISGVNWDEFRGIEGEREKRTKIDGNVVR